MCRDAFQSLVHSSFLCIFCTLCAFSALAQPIFHSLDGPIDGYCTALAKHTDTLYAGLYQSGVYRSTDLGENWAATNIVGGDIDEILPYDSTTILVSDNSQFYRYSVVDNSIVRLREGQCFVPRERALFAGSYGGIWVSTNLGSNWSYRSDGMPYQARYYDLKGFGDSVLFCCGSVPGVYRSENNGMFWTTFGLDTVVLRELLVVDTTLYAASNYSFFRSPVNRNDWEFLGAIGYINSLDVLPNRHVMLRYDLGTLLEFDPDSNRYSFHGVPPGGAYAFLALDDTSWIVGSSYHGTYKTTNAGAAWEMHQEHFVGSFPKALALYRNRLYCGLSGLQTQYYTTQNGWQSGTNFPYFTNTFTVWGDRLLAGGFYGGISYTDDGDLWHYGNGADFRVETIAVYDSTIAFASGRFANGIYLTTNRGETWSFSDTLSQVRALLVTNQGTLLASHDALGLYRSTDMGLTWQRTYTGMLYVRIVQSPTGTVYAGSESEGYWSTLLKSTNDGLTWIPCNNTRSMSDLTVDRIGTLYVGRGTPFPAYYSTDEGETWDSVGIDLPQPLTGFAARGFTISDSGVLYCGLIGRGVFSTFTPVVSMAEQNPHYPLPQDFKMFAYPNPFNEQIRISLLPQSLQPTSIAVYNSSGQLVWLFRRSTLSQTTPYLDWKPNNLASGRYWILATSNNRSISIPVLYLK